MRWLEGIVRGGRKGMWEIGENGEGGRREESGIIKTKGEIFFFMLADARKWWERVRLPYIFSHGRNRSLMVGLLLSATISYTMYAANLLYGIYMDT